MKDPALAEHLTQDELLKEFAGGNPAAFERLLLANHTRLVAYIGRQLPADLNRFVSPDDIAQETFTVAFRSQSTFSSRGTDSFYRWLATIARHRILDAGTRWRAAKRGGDKNQPILLPARADQSMVIMLEQLAVHEKTPSHWARMKESVGAMQVAMASLKEDLRLALELRYIQGLPVAEIAVRMGRTDGAIQMLCNRGLKQLRATMGRASDYLSWSQ
jgi:RNA polymerase sigma-70 factor (ECF subfamily)